MLSAGVALCKLERQLLVSGWPQLHASAEPCAVLCALVEVLVETQQQQQRLGAVSLEAADRLMPLLLLLAKLMMEVQDLHPLAMSDCLPRAIAFYHGQLVSREFTPGGDDLSEKFLVRCLMALRNTLSTSAYLPTARAAPQAHTCHQALAAFFGSAALAQLCRALLTRALVLSPAELEEYEEDPEAFVHEESVARETEGLRKCAERCLQTLADTAECKQQVQQAVLALCSETAAAGLQGQQAVLALDACYLALGLVLQPGEHERSAQLLAALQRHCAEAAPAHAHLLRRRAAWLLGHLMRSPPRRAGGADGAAVGVEGGDPGDPLWFAMLSQLLADAHPGVRLTAAISLRALLDAEMAPPGRAEGVGCYAGCPSPCTAASATLPPPRVPPRAMHAGAVVRSARAAAPSPNSPLLLSPPRAGVAARAVAARRAGGRAGLARRDREAELDDLLRRGRRRRRGAEGDARAAGGERLDARAAAQPVGAGHGEPLADDSAADAPAGRLG